MDSGFKELTYHLAWCLAPGDFFHRSSGQLTSMASKPWLSSKMFFAPEETHLRKKALRQRLDRTLGKWHFWVWTRTPTFNRPPVFSPPVPSNWEQWKLIKVPLAALAGQTRTNTGFLVGNIFNPTKTFRLPWLQNFGYTSLENCASLAKNCTCRKLLLAIISQLNWTTTYDRNGSLVIIFKKLPENKYHPHIFR